MDEKRPPAESSRAFQTRREREEVLREQIIASPSPYTELMSLAGIDIHDKETREIVIEALRYHYLAQKARRNRDLKRSGLILAGFTAFVGAVAAFILSHIWNLISWLNGSGTR